jgi:hypothetical protein
LDDRASGEAPSAEAPQRADKINLRAVRILYDDVFAREVRRSGESQVDLLGPDDLHERKAYPIDLDSRIRSESGSSDTNHCSGGKHAATVADLLYRQAAANT